MDISPERKLGIATFLQACIDYKYITNRMPQLDESSEEYQSLKEDLDDIQEFFKTEWCKILIGGNRDFRGMTDMIADIDTQVFRDAYTELVYVDENLINNFVQAKVG